LDWTPPKDTASDCAAILDQLRPLFESGALKAPAVGERKFRFHG